MSWEIVILKTAKYVKNIALFIICFILAFVISMYGMPLNSLTQSVVDWSYAHFSHILTGVYESESDPVTFTALMVMLLLYALILFFIIKKGLSFFRK
ncbi:hypothetical protein PMPD1_2462 [Paramixta manurensis]|uniref:Uncharacterized protein n=1 Tax=Paramixta manurensis TaxID=2740817 RepID=A0A6M8UCS6_9GAMM|nr:hypothetical protein PMPD1_2462 [Erwiniaceae bacterium PD-1]